MSIVSPIKGADSSDNNALDVKELDREGYKVLIQRRTGGIDIANGKRVPYVDRRFDVTNRALRDTDIIPGDYAFPIHPDFLDIDVQVDRFLHTCPTDFDGRIIAIDYELYGPNPDATISPGALKEYLRELRKHIGRRHILMYAGKGFWEEPPHSGQLSDYGEHMHMWNPWYWSMDGQGAPLAALRERPQTFGLVEALRGGAARLCSILHRQSGGDPVGHKCLALGYGRHPSSDKTTRIVGLVILMHPSA
jgi:hypothetical protein